MRIVGDRMAAGFERFAVGQHDLHADDVPPGRAVPQPVAAGVVEGQDAAHRGHAAGRRVGAELPAERGQIAIELAQHDARLHRDRVAVDAHDPPHGPAKSSTRPGPSDSPARPVPAPRAWIGMRLLGGIPHGGLHVGQPARPHDAQRPHLIDAGVGGVHLRERIVAMDFAREQAAQVGLNSFALWSMGDEVAELQYAQSGVCRTSTAASPSEWPAADCQPDPLLAVLLVRFQVERLVVFQAGHAAVLGLAAVALQHVADHDVQHHVDQRRGEQHAVGPQRHAVVPEDRADHEAEHDDRHAQPLRKILADEQLGAGADEAARDSCRPSRRRPESASSRWQCGTGQLASQSARTRRGRCWSQCGQRKVTFIVQCIIADNGASADEQLRRQFADERQDHRGIENARRALRVGNLQRLPGQPGQAQHAHDPRQPAQRDEQQPRSSSTGSCAGRRRSVPAPVPLPQTIIRSNTAAASSTISRRSGASFIVGVLRYQWPSSIAVVTKPSSKPPVIRSAICKRDWLAAPYARSAGSVQPARAQRRDEPNRDLARQPPLVHPDHRADVAQRPLRQSPARTATVRSACRGRLRARAE